MPSLQNYQQSGYFNWQFFDLECAYHAAVRIIDLDGEDF